MNKDNNTNFWISYADLMAGLLFVFILLIGAIVVKYSLLQSESKILKRTLNAEKIALKNKEEKIKNTVIDLEQTKHNLLSVSQKYELAKNDLINSQVENEKLKNFLKNNEKVIKDQKEEIINKIEEINVFRTLKKEYENKFTKLKVTEEDLLASLNLLNLSVKQKDKKVNILADDIILKEKLITAFKNQNEELSDELKVLYERLKNTETKHTLLAQDLQQTKEKIKSLTGIKVKVITLLKSALGQNMKIDPKNGAIRLSSNILFDEGEYKLKDTSKKALKNAVYDYFNAILENKDINRHIDKVIVEGHTNSKGSFLYNLELSQKRAYAVMDFLLSLDFNKKEDLRDLVVASGRSFLDPIYDKSGNEDRDESRRIEIKFNLKNEEAIKEIESILDK